MLYGYRTPILVLLLTVCLAGTAWAQTTITASDLEAQIGETNSVASFTSEDTQALQQIVDAEGENQTYDFSNVSASSTITGSVTYLGDPGDLPSGEEFPSSNYVIALEFGLEGASEDSTIWIYNRLESDAAYTLGSAFIFSDPATGAEDTLTLSYEDPLLNFPLPLTYGESWTDTSDIFGVETVTEAVIEGWGTLVLPTGSFDALRMRETTTTNLFGFEEVSSSINFFTARNDAGAAIYLGEDNATAESAEYTAYGIDTAVEDDELPATARLKANYPNPFNPATTFGFELENAEHVRVTVHDVLGRTVAVLVDGLRPAGRHEVSFDAEGLPSGTYMYRLQTPGVTQTRAMVLTK